MKEAIHVIVDVTFSLDDNHFSTIWKETNDDENVKKKGKKLKFFTSMVIDRESILNPYWYHCQLMSMNNVNVDPIWLDLMMTMMMLDY